ncbi:MAG: DnaJ domain-containing protein [bacterium]|nr:DnaJ domain-containing protein [bacterium]
MRESDLSNYYSMLGVTSSASVDEIEESYAKLSLKYKQLLESGLGLIDEKHKAEVDFEIITLAYTALVDEKGRSIYDQLLPDGVKSWDDRFGKEKTVCNWWGAPLSEPEVKARQRKTTGGNTRETFGVPMRNRDPSLSSFDRPEILRPVSQMIRSRQSIWYKVKRFLFGW